MRRLVLLLFVSFLVASTGGILDLVAPDPCSPSESASTPDDGTCPATCVRCHCARAFDLAVHPDVGDAPLLTVEWLPPSTVVRLPIPHDILHVPRPALG